MSDIFREVDEALQQEKAAKFWKEYGPTLILAAVVMVLSTAVFTGLKSWNAHRDGEETTRLISALESENTSEKLAEIIGDTRKNHEAIALFQAAALYSADNEFGQAAALYLDAAQNRKTPKALKDLARILYVRSISQAEDTTTETPPDNLSILQPVLDNPKSPYHWHAQIEAAVIAAHEQNDYQKALGFLAPFETAADIPVSLQELAQSLRHVYSLKSQAATENTQG